MKVKMSSTLILLSTFFIILNCKKEDCIFDNSFNQKQDKKNLKTDLMIFSNNNFCNELLLKGDFGYYLKSYKIEKFIYLSDSVYSYNENNSKNILFDFSSKKEKGILKVNDSITIKTNYLMDIRSNNKTFRLFEIKNIDKYYTLNLSRVYITNYNYGIVGEFILVKENNVLGAVKIEGYIPNEKYFFSIFKEVKIE